MKAVVVMYYFGFCVRGTIITLSFERIVNDGR